jgi:hypothetical protein
MRLNKLDFQVEKIQPRLVLYQDQFRQENDKLDMGASLNRVV